MCLIKSEKRVKSHSPVHFFAGAGVSGALAASFLASFLFAPSGLAKEGGGAGTLTLGAGMAVGAGDGLEETGTEASASALILSNLAVIPSMILPKDWVDDSVLVKVSSVILRSFWTSPSSFALSVLVWSCLSMTSCFSWPIYSIFLFFFRMRFGETLWAHFFSALGFLP